MLPEGSPASNPASAAAAIPRATANLSCAELGRMRGEAALGLPGVEALLEAWLVFVFISSTPRDFDRGMASWDGGSCASASLASKNTML